MQFRKRVAQAAQCDKEACPSGALNLTVMHDKVRQYYEGSSSLGSLNMYRQELLDLWEYIVYPTIRHKLEA